MAISAYDGKGEEKIVHKFINEVGSNQSDRDPEFYMRFLQNLWLESTLSFLHCIHEGRMKQIHLRPPQNETEIFIVESKLAIDDLIALGYYLDNFDKKHVRLESVVIKDCDIRDDSLAVLGNKVTYIYFMN